MPHSPHVPESLGRDAPSRPQDRRWLTLLTLCFAVLIAQGDTSIVNLAARPIGAAFQVGVGPLQWVVDSYNLAYAAFLLTGGLVADLFGRRLAFAAGAAVFTAASLLSALAPTISVLIAGRALAGLGAGLLLPASLAIIRVVWPDRQERGRALGIWAGCNGLALAVGPALGGLLVSVFGWRSIFLIVIPLGIAAVVLAGLAVPESADPQDRHFDAAGQVLGVVVLGGLAFGAIESRDAGGFAAVALLVAAGALALFVRVEARRGTAALVPLDMFRLSDFRGAIVATAGMTFGMYGVLFLLPLAWQNAGRLDPVGAGVALMPMALVFVLVSSVSGALSEKFGARRMAAWGVGVIGCGLLLVAAAAHSSSLAVVEVGLGLAGLGMGLATGQLMDLAVGALFANRAGTAAALINVARMAGATIGVAVLGAVFAASGDGPQGLRNAMLLGGLVQLSSAATLWFVTRRTRMVGG